MRVLVTFFIAASISPGATLIDPVARLSAKLEHGEARLAFDPVYGYLPAVLKALDISEESQLAVFSKTSGQAIRIEPSRPRVIFFNDAVTVGWVRGGFMELAAQDPNGGIAFYRLNQRETVSGATGSPITRQQDCMHCHSSGMLMRSVFTSADGVPVHGAPQYDTDYRTPFEKLWGGWYVTGHVTGQAGSVSHMGQGNLVSLDGKCDPRTRLTPYSDIVALMVLEHQTRVMNLLARAAKEPVALTELADALLFAGEPALKGAIAGTSGFTEAFAARGPRDSHGRSLRDVSLKGRLMRYPCSYMIYSEAFDALPPNARSAVYSRLWHLLSSRPPTDRKAIVEILRETKPGLPGYFVVD
jgi:hypothetical protein